MFGTQHSYGMEAITDIYLGLPTQIGVDRSDSFIHLIERVIERLKRFIEIFLSCSGYIWASVGPGRAEKSPMHKN
jgi:hypothetical protein